MIWPVNLVNCALFRTLHNDHRHQEDGYWTMTRLRFFFFASFFQFIWYWLPGYICPVLSLFSWICMLKPDNVILSQLAGINGLGIGSIELDWNAWVSFLGSPIVVPFWFVDDYFGRGIVSVHLCSGHRLIFWSVLPLSPGSFHPSLTIRICGVPKHSPSSVVESSPRTAISTMSPLFSHRNYVWMKPPINSTVSRWISALWRRTNRMSFLGGLRMSAVFALSYAISFAAISAVIMHTILYNGLSTERYESFDWSTLI